MHLVVNGEPLEHSGEGTLSSLLRELGADGRRVATMINGEIVPRDGRSSATLRDGDRIEVLAFAGGG